MRMDAEERGRETGGLKNSSASVAEALRFRQRGVKNECVEGSVEVRIQILR